MTINSTHDLVPGDLYTTTGKDVWCVESYISCPSVTMINIETRELCGGGVGCLNLQPFVRLVREKEE